MPITEGDIVYTYRFVADAQTARTRARAVPGWTNRQRRTRCCYVILFGANMVIDLAVLGLYNPTATSLFWAATFSTLLTAAFALLVSTAGYAWALKDGRVWMFDGAVIESGFGRDAMVLRNPLSSSRVSYAAVKSLTATGDWVVLQRKGSPTSSMHARVLFPDDAIAYVNARLTP